MYNDALKKKFLAGYTKSLNTAQVATTVFDALEPYEKTYGRDMCTFSVEELQPVLDNILGLRYRSKWMTVFLLRDYVRWCIVSKYPDACESIMHVSLAGLDKLRKQMVSNPLHLQLYLDSVFPPVEEETVDIIYRCFLWMGYFGISEEDSMLVERQHVDLENMLIRYGGVDYKIYPEAIPAFRSAITLTDFTYHHPLYTNSIRRERAAGTTLVRGLKPNLALLTVRSNVSRRLAAQAKEGKTDMQLSYYRVWLSGLFYRTYELERAGIPPDFSEAAINNARAQLEPENPEARKKINRKASDYKEDYRRWKLAFSI